MNLYGGEPFSDEPLVFWRVWRILETTAKMASLGADPFDLFHDDSNFAAHGHWVVSIWPQIYFRFYSPVVASHRSWN